MSDPWAVGEGSSDAEDALRLGLAHQRAGRLAEAEALYRRVLTAQPDQAEAWHLLGRLRHESGDPDAAVDLIRRAITLDPDAAHYVKDLGDVCAAAGRLSEAIACYRQAVALRRDGFREARIALAAALEAQGRLDEIEACARVGLDGDRDQPVSRDVTAIPAVGAGRGTAVIEGLRQQVRIHPDQAAAHFDLGNALYLQGELDTAIEHYQTAVALAPRWVDAHNNLGHARKDQARLDDALACFRTAITLDPGRADIHSNLLYTLWYHAGSDPEGVVEEHRRWAALHADPLTVVAARHSNERDPGRRLRVGYVSPDFRQHPLGLLIEPVLAAHDREAFEVVCYADVPSPDDHTRRLQQHADRWRWTSGLPHARLADAIREDRIDILVDLSLHMAGNRLLVFARKPAPIQVTYLAYPATSGMRAMDYRITDVHLDPPDGAEHRGLERLIRLPDTYWCYPGATEPPIASGPMTPRALTFGSLNNFCKLNPPVLRVWAEILRALPTARLALLVNGRSRAYRTLLVDCGIPNERVDLFDRRSRADYLRLYERIDIGLDPFPCSGHTTSLDALWMGVPVVTLAGPTAMGRGTVSQLSNLGLSDLIAGDPLEYVRCAVGLAGQRDRLRDFRRGLRDRLRSSPLLDGSRLARDLEAGYRDMWVTWCADETSGGRRPPSSFHRRSS